MFNYNYWNNLTYFHTVQSEPIIRVWHGLHQKVGHLGDAQDDFNLMGEVSGPDSIVSLQYFLNDIAAVNLSIGRGRYGFKRNAGDGFFNADIPIKKLNPGINKIILSAEDIKGNIRSILVSLEKNSSTNYPLPVEIDWGNVVDPQDVGQYVDGEWVIEKNGLRTVHSGYDRIFLIGDKSWQDYEVMVPVTINRVDTSEGNKKFDNGVGILMRFTGHVSGGHRSFANAQPKDGYQPFGSIGWLRWIKHIHEEFSRIQFYSGFSDETLYNEKYCIEVNETYVMKMRCETLSKIPKGEVLWEKQIFPKNGDIRFELPEIPVEEEGITQYSFKIWEQDEFEPEKWNFQITQVSRNANRKGAFALLAHHVDATFGNITVSSLGSNRKMFLLEKSKKL